ncbi:hypothetical protein GH714_022881 [Hevea brasiliensis]|uniref:Hexosyltransferase n=1 Tax=Hevea brasiliensis TaxID=3981 RepID=A0A6A6NIS7_HEVBR|nr:hypothetical protein GH714_022881 [Hevea brasiliensis]
MEGVSATMYTKLRAYWRRRGYQRLNKSTRRRMNQIELGSTRRRRFWRIKIKPKLKIFQIASPKKLFIWLRDTYVRMMLGFANSRLIGAGGYGYGFPDGIAAFEKGPLKEYDEKLIIEIYKSLVKAQSQSQLVPHDTARELSLSRKKHDTIELSRLCTTQVVLDVVTEMNRLRTYGAMIMIILSPSLQSFSPAEAIRSSHLDSFLGNLAAYSPDRFSFRKAAVFRNADKCSSSDNLISGNTGVCDPNLVHVAITLDFKVYYFDPDIVRNLISTSVRQALEQPLNYARNYLADLLEPCVRRVIYLDSDLVVVDDIAKLWTTNLGSRTIGAPEYCHANFTKYFTASFWSNTRFSSTFSGRKSCYFNTGVMVIDLAKWRRVGYTKRIERWMEIQKSDRIYELGSLPPFLLVFAGHVAPIEHRWNQHGLGGDNVRGSCRDLHPGAVSLLHWSGSGKPWLRIDSRQPCPLDALWAPYDLYGHSH